MKRQLTIVALLASTLFSSCNKEVINAPLTAEKAKVSFIAGGIETKTVFGDKDSDNHYPLLWTGEKTIGISFNGGAAAEVTPVVANGGANAYLSHEFEIPDGTVSYTFRLFSPYDALTSKSLTEDSFNVFIPASQISTPQGPDADAQLIYALSGELDDLPEAAPLTFSHITAYLHIFFKNVSLASGASVQSVSISAPSGCYIAGRARYDVGSASFSFTEGYVVPDILVSTSSIDNGIWCGIMPADFSGKTLTITVNTDKGSVSKTVTMPAIASLKPGEIGKFTVNMSGIDNQAPVEFELVTSESALNFGDQIIIASADYDYAIGLNEYSANTAGAGIVRTGNVIKDPSAGVQVFTLGDGLVPGTWSLCGKGGKYLHAVSGKNSLQSQDNLDDVASWSISFGDLTPTDLESPDAQRAIIQSYGAPRYIRYKHSDVYFGAYASSTAAAQTPVKIYRKKGSADTTPRFKVTQEDGTFGDIEISSSEQVVGVYVFGNVSWTASVTGGASLSATSGNGPAILELNVPKNSTSSAKECTVTVSTSASVSQKSYSFKVTQSKLGYDMELTFDFTDMSKVGSWPTSNPGDGNDYTYVLDGATYHFMLNTVYISNGECMVINKAHSLGLPAIQGYALTMVSVHLRDSNTSGRNVSITDDSMNAVSGGENQKVTVDHEFNLVGTLPGTMYYIYNTSGGIPLYMVTLGYIKDDSASGSSVSPGQAGASMRNPLLIYSF